MYLFLQVEDKGVYSMTHLCFSTAGIDFLKNFPPNTISFEVTCDDPSVTVEPVQGKLLML